MTSRKILDLRVDVEILCAARVVVSLPHSIAYLQMLKSRRLLIDAASHDKQGKFRRSNVVFVLSVIPGDARYSPFVVRDWAKLCSLSRR